MNRAWAYGCAVAVLSVLGAGCISFNVNLEDLMKPCKDEASIVLTNLVKGEDTTPLTDELKEIVMNDAGQACYRLLETDGRSLRAGIGPVKDPQIFAKKLKRSKRLKVLKIEDRVVEIEARRR